MNNYYGYQQPYGYQMGYQNGYNNPYQGYPQMMNQMTNQPQVQQPTQNNESSIIMCDSVDYVKSQNVRLDGGTNYYGLTNGQSIYTKKLNPNTGSSIIQEYRLVNNEEEKPKENDPIVGMIQTIQDNINEVKNIVLEYATNPIQANQKGGVKR